MSNPFSVKSAYLFSSWVYNLPKNHECTICRCNLNSPSLYNQEKCIDSYVVSGVCGHSFHHECIKPWVDKNKHCPLCSQVWQFTQQSFNPPSNDSNKKSTNFINDNSKKISITQKDQFSQN
jgi:hypothetical protein